MFIVVQFKNRNKVFTGRTYSYLLSNEEEIPKIGSIIRLMDEEYNYINHGTRVKVVSIEATSEIVTPIAVRYIVASMDE